VNTGKKLEGPYWGLCVFGEKELTEFLVGPKDKSVLALYGDYMARYVYEDYVRASLLPAPQGRRWSHVT
jgi:hypothetical protein